MLCLTDITGKERSGSKSIRHWIRTGNSGVGAFGTLPGKLEILATKHGWRSQEQEVVINDNEPLTVTIKREPDQVK